MDNEDEIRISYPAKVIGSGGKDRKTAYISQKSMLLEHAGIEIGDTVQVLASAVKGKYIVLKIILIPNEVVGK